MGIPVLILGESGSGKSTSLRNFEPNEVAVVGVVGKPLPFKATGVKVFNLNKKAKENGVDRYDLLKGVISRANKSDVNTIVIDDSQYLLAFDSFDKAKSKGFDKFTEMALAFKDLIEYCIDNTNDNKIIYFLHHVETTEQGKIKIKTIGKMLDNQLTVEGLFTIVILCQASKSVHKFITDSDGTSTAKTPMGMFESTEIDNDLKIVDEAIRKYYEI